VPQYKPSKSEKKREVLAAVTAASGIKSRGALRRQCQLIGKLMRNVDPEPIRRAIENLQRQERADKKIFKRAEHWRDRIVEGRHGGLNEFFEVTGSSSGDLSSMLDEYLAVPQESGRRALRKRIFRQVHEELTKATIGR
jgi:ribosome-associated protein